MGIRSFVTGLFNPVTDLLGKIVTKEEDILQVKAAISRIENEIASKLLEYETKLLESKTKVLVADAQGASWLQRTWRPITMLTFLCLIIADTFGLTTFRLTDKAWTLLQLGLGGYVIGRSAEKIVPNVIKSLKTSPDK